jgi:hypothetical protein
VVRAAVQRGSAVPDAWQAPGSAGAREADDAHGETQAGGGIVPPEPAQAADGGDDAPDYPIGFRVNRFAFIGNTAFDDDDELLDAPIGVGPLLQNGTRDGGRRGRRKRRKSTAEVTPGRSHGDGCATRPAGSCAPRARPRRRWRVTSARDTMELVRSDSALGYGNAAVLGSFRSEVGPLYYELADLLIGRSAEARLAGEDAQEPVVDFSPAWR